MFSVDDEKWMRRALELAHQAETQGEVPIGAVLVLDNECIGEGFNSPIQHKDPTAHAEILALRQAALQTDNYRLPGTTLYITLEPCIMCLGAIVHARIQRVVFAALEPRAGAIRSAFQILEKNKLNHKVVCEHGLFAEESSLLLSNFFKKRRS